MKKRVVVAMSGGVDSSVAACLLKERGFEVIGITMCFNITDTVKKKPSCCGKQGINDAKEVSYKLGIKHYVINMQKDLEKWVIKDFCSEYLKGRTPNPCIRCNQYVKFSALLKRALSMDAQFLATGHYARIIKSRNCLLKKGKDKNKDQSYFLYRLNQDQLKHILFPLGNYTKNEVRALARKFHLPVADKIGSQEICFLPQADYRRFLEKQITRKIKPGLIVDKEGLELGKHKGIPFYTIGQREGLGIAMGYPIYITKIDKAKNRIVIGRKEDSLKSEFLVKEPHFIQPLQKKKVALGVKIRYNHKETKAEVRIFKNEFKVKCKEPQFAITPGQAAVLYDGDKVVGGGMIDKVLD